MRLEKLFLTIVSVGLELQLDDWVLCRIYNKKGKIEKYNNGDAVVDQKPAKLAEEVLFEHEMKPEIKMYGHDHFRNNQLYMDTSDSVPRLNTDSSCSEHVVSPDGTCEKEVQSEPKWNDLELGPDLVSGYDFNFMELSSDDAFAPQTQYQMNQPSPWLDMFAYLPKTF